MCGFSGYFFENLKKGDLKRSLEKSNYILNHRGPDSNGFYYDKELNLGLAHNRLSIIDTSERGHQPMVSQCGNFVLVFNGEIYNFKELKDFLNSEKNIIWESDTDTEVLLNLYIYSIEKNLTKASFLKKLNGIFSFALWDKKNHELILVRDAFGVKPLYYSLFNKGIVFASEIKSLVCLLPSLLENNDSKFKQVDLSAINKYLTFLWCPGNSTPNKFVKKLNPGELLCFSDISEPEFIQWNSTQISKDKIVYNSSSKNIIDHTQFLLEQAVHRQMVSDVPLGAFLSGGLDSSSIALFAKEKNPNISCFSIDLKGGPEDGFIDDLPYAKKVSKILDLPLEIISIDPSIITTSIEEMIWQLDEPLADPAAFNVFFISKLARDNGIKVLLSGAGGDDIFSGYKRHHAIQYDYLLEKIPNYLLKKISNMAYYLSANNPYTRKLKKYLSGLCLDKSDRLINYFKWIDRLDLINIFSSDFRNELIKFDEDVPMKDFLEQLPKDLSNLDKILNLEQRFFLSDHNLNYTDKMSMAASVEVRVPFLDNELVNYVSRLPDIFKHREGQNKWLLKKIMEKFLPNEIVYRPKSGFGVPIRKWLKDDLEDWLMEILSKKRIDNRGLFNSNAVHSLIEKNKKGKVDATYTLYSLACIEVWCMKYL